jgi:hypothetical protein
MTSDSPAAVYVWALGHARGLPTWRLRWMERRVRRRSGRMTARQLATRAAIPHVLIERGIDLPDP